MKLTLTAAQLRAAEACEEGVVAFIAAFGDSAEVEWTRDTQIAALRGPLGRWVGWAHWNGLLPLWSMRDSNLSDSNLRDSDLSGSDLSGSNLSGAKVCLCGSAPCVQLLETLAAAGWAPSSDGLLARVQVPT